MPVTGQDTVLKNIAKFGGGFRKHVYTVMDNVGKRLDVEITANMSLSEHTQEDLNKLDHPYALRHGSHGKPIHMPYWMVHKQTGTLISSKKRGTTPVDISGMNVKVSTWVGLDATIAPHANYVVWGTSRMIPRDFLGGSLNTLEFKADVFQYIKKNLRDMVVNFRGLETSNG